MLAVGVRDFLWSLEGRCEVKETVSGPAVMCETEWQCHGEEGKVMDCC